ncbi:MAG: ATP-dependent Clp protease adaptor ClpS [Gemmataceae bacterium]|nr:ATP-dependent Clp protease adaptor ClpS [Gemmataceae bacterium]
MSQSFDEPMVTTRTKPKTSPKHKMLPPYHVVIYNDPHHSMEFVIDTLCKVLRCEVDRAIQLMMEAHTKDRAVVWTGAKEVAELKVEQIRTCHEKRSSGQDLGPLHVDMEPAA